MKRPAFALGLLALGTQLLSFAPAPREPLSAHTDAWSAPDHAPVAIPGATAGVPAIPTYQGKRWWGLCGAYAADSVSALYREYQASSLLQSALDGFDWGKARLVVLDAARQVFVNYAHASGTVAWSSKPLTLPEGEVLITDRADPWDETSGFLVRTYCCNRVSLVSRPPTRQDEPPVEELDRTTWPVHPAPDLPPTFVPGEGQALAPPPLTVFLPPAVVLPPPPVVVASIPPGIVSPPVVSIPPGIVSPPATPLPEPPPPVPSTLVPGGPETHPVPEPSTCLLFGLGLLALALRRAYARR